MRMVVFSATVYVVFVDDELVLMNRPRLFWYLAVYLDYLVSQLTWAFVDQFDTVDVEVDQDGIATLWSKSDHE